MVHALYFLQPYFVHKPKRRSYCHYLGLLLLLLLPLSFRYNKFKALASETNSTASHDLSCQLVSFLRRPSFSWHHEQIWKSHHLAWRFICNFLKHGSMVNLWKVVIFILSWYKYFKSYLAGAQPLPCCSFAHHLAGKMVVHCSCELIKISTAHLDSLVISLHS